MRKPNLSGVPVSLPKWEAKPVPVTIVKEKEQEERGGVFYARRVQ